MLIKHLKNVNQAFQHVNQPVENVKYVWKNCLLCIQKIYAKQIQCEQMFIMYLTNIKRV